MDQHNSCIAERILGHLDIVVLQRVQPGRYIVLGEPPDFYKAFFPADSEPYCSMPWLHSFMLAFFYESAEDFFSKQTPGRISSGVWEEEGLCMDSEALVAEAITFKETQVITLRLLKDIYQDRTSILRKARELLLEQRLLSSDLEKLKITSRTDGLTKVLNRTAFMELMPMHLDRAQETGVPFSLIMLDIDHFKKINDNFGHQAGDMVLSRLGGLLLSTLRRDDLVGRYGGEEFIVFLLTPRKQAPLIAEKLRKKIAGHRFENLPEITISLGYTSYCQGDSVEDLIRRADQALYNAKKNGRNMVCEG